ncbi:helix-turn-helix domain-containing protein [Streptomyces melanogenes]|uniref:helix-turn-helix domain-containing protein n=1 Tax=Streptomyces melanogenes TaxID=67326 RepID=UPI00167DAAD3|nr:helix-turn-helix domain-containing protein [Streptomyces melanogenes]
MATTPPQPRDQADQAEQPLNEVKFLTLAEAAAVMRVSERTVRRLIQSGHLPAIAVGQSFRIPERAVHDFLHPVGRRTPVNRI